MGRGRKRGRASKRERERGKRRLAHGRREGGEEELLCVRDVVPRVRTPVLLLLVSAAVATGCCLILSLASYG